MSWFFLWMEYGIISLISSGFYHNQDGVFWEISQKLCFGVFLLFLKKWPSSITNQLGPLFFTIKQTWSLNFVKNGQAVWSESWVEVAALDRKQKWTITLHTFGLEKIRFQAVSQMKILCLAGKKQPIFSLFTTCTSKNHRGVPLIHFFGEMSFLLITPIQTTLKTMAFFLGRQDSFKTTSIHIWIRSNEYTV